MNEHVLVNSKDHSDIKIRDHFSPELSDGSNSAMVFPIEFRDVQSHYPIFFQKNAESGKFYSVALLGFEQGENLYLNSSGWDATYIPLMIRKQPFYIGKKQAQDSLADQNAEMVVTMDPQDPRVNGSEGNEIFNADGSPTEFLNEKIAVLEQVHQGHEHAEGFIEALIGYDLIEQFTLEITLHDGGVKQLLGFYTVKEEAVRSLSGDALASLSEAGYLMPLFMVLASHSRIRDLIDRKFNAGR